MADVYVKRGDLQPIVRARLLDADQQPVPVAADADVTFTLRPILPRGSAPILNGVAATRVAPSSFDPEEEGWVEYAWEDGDTDVPGGFRAEFQILDDAGAQIQTYPNDGHIRIHIEDDLEVETEEEGS